MIKFSRILIAMDLSGMDDRLLDMAARLRKIGKTEKLYFLHVMPDFIIPKDVDIEFHKRFAPEYPVDEKVRDKLAEEIQQVLGEWPNVEFAIDVREGKPYEKLIRWLDIKDVDLLLIGKKKESEGSGITARKVARHSKSNILFVPDKELSTFRRILVPVDFSANSARAVKTALQFKAGLPDAEVECLYVVDTPPADYYVGPAKDTGFRAVLRESAEKAFHSFFADYGLPVDEITLRLEENIYSNIAVHIKEYAENNEADFIIMGAQGHSALENFIFGSITEKLVERNTEKPILIIR